MEQTTEYPFRHFSYGPPPETPKTMTLPEIFAEHRAIEVEYRALRAECAALMVRDAELRASKPYQKQALAFDRGFLEAQGRFGAALREANHPERGTPEHEALLNTFNEEGRANREKCPLVMEAFGIGQRLSEIGFYVYNGSYTCKGGRVREIQDRGGELYNLLVLEYHIYDEYAACRAFEAGEIDEHGNEVKA